MAYEDRNGPGPWGWQGKYNNEPFPTCNGTKYHSTGWGPVVFDRGEAMGHATNIFNREVQPLIQREQQICEERERQAESQRRQQEEQARIQQALLDSNAEANEGTLEVAQASVESAANLANEANENIASTATQAVVTTAQATKDAVKVASEATEKNIISTIKEYEPLILGAIIAVSIGSLIFAKK